MIYPYFNVYIHFLIAFYNMLSRELLLEVDQLALHRITDERTNLHHFGTLHCQDAAYMIATLFARWR